MGEVVHMADNPEHDLCEGKTGLPCCGHKTAVGGDTGICIGFQHDDIFPVIHAHVHPGISVESQAFPGVQGGLASLSVQRGLM